MNTAIDSREREHRCERKNTSPTTLSLTDLNLDCLNKLLKHLDIIDVTILARTNLGNHRNLDQAFTTETSSTTHPYEASIRDRFLQLGYTDNCLTNNPDCILFERTVFRYFGKLIPSVRLDYDTNYQRHNSKIEEVILEYGMTLHEIELINADMSAFEDIKTPFPNVTKLRFEGGWIGRTFLELYKWFPNLTSLSLNCTKISDHQRFFKQNHPNLIQLSVRNKFLCRCYRMNRNVVADNVLDYVISNLHLKRFLNLNPQLENLSLVHDREDTIFEPDNQPEQFLLQINFDFLHFIKNTLAQLCYLKLNIREMHRLQIPTHLIILDLKTLVVEVSETDRLTQINILSPDLNRLEITVDSPTQDFEFLSDFVVRFKTIDALSIGPHPLVSLDNDKVVHMIKTLTNLKVLQIALYEHHFFNDLCYIIKKFDHLHTVRISCTEISGSNRETFLNVVNENYFLKVKNWRGCCAGNEFEFKKSI